MAKVLIVEDDHFLGAAYRAKLSKTELEFRLATDGEEALSVLKDFVPDVILLDLIMPRKDGFTVLAEVKQDARLKDIPIIVASNLGQPSDRERAMKLGAVDFITKSELSLDAVLEKISQYLPKN